VYALVVFPVLFKITWSLVGFNMVSTLRLVLANLVKGAFFLPAYHGLVNKRQYYPLFHQAPKKIELGYH
jgi:hypothetical protein